MGLSVDKAMFTPQEYARFSHRLDDSLVVLRELLQRDGFGAGTPSIGAELELCLVDSSGRPALLNETLHSNFADPRLTLELNRYNLEYNTCPYTATGAPLTALQEELEESLARLSLLAERHHCRVAAVGILPTLTEADFGDQVMTDQFRYHALRQGLLGLRHGEAFHIGIDGAESVSVDADHVTYEGANTSFQLHLRTAPDQFADLYNAVQLVSPIAVAMSANSPFLLGHNVWQETRIALFEQSIDTRVTSQADWSPPGRVSFGQGWLREGAYELFAEAVRLYPPLLPTCADKHPRQQLEAGMTPNLLELRLHEGTVWYWNRAVYDPADNGHLRIEMRTLSAGPTVEDMLASAAFLLGAAMGLQSTIAERITALPFSLARYNFYRAAQYGLSAELVWPSLDQHQPLEYPVLDIARYLLPIARQGLIELGLTAKEANRWLAVIEARLERAINGAQWQIAWADYFSRGMSRSSALQAMTELYIEEQQSGRPLHEWSVP